MSKKRVFVAINLPNGIKKELGKIIEESKSLFGPEVRFLSPENWHLTLEFLAYQDDHSIHLITKALEKVGGSFPPPVVEFEKITYGPIGKTPRMIWLTGSKTTSEELAKIKDFLEKELVHLGVRFRQEVRVFNAHLTLARFEAVSAKALPPLDIPFRRSFEADSIDLMESRLRRSGAEYLPLNKIAFVAEVN